MTTADRSTAGTTNGLGNPDANSAGQTPQPGICRHEGLAPRPAIARPERRGRGPGLAGLNDLLERLSPRDLAVLDLIGDHRLLTSHQVEGFCFHDHATSDAGARTTRRVLARLERERLLERPARRIGGLLAGSTASTWMLTSTGQRLLNLRAGVGAVGRARAPGERFIAHYLAVADVHLALVRAERAGRLSVVQLQLEPACWRPLTGIGGSREILKPDLYALTVSSREATYEDHWFIEVDRATESLPTLIGQCRAYETYRRSGHEQVDRGVFPLVVWVVPDARRADKLAEAIAASRRIDPRLFRITTPNRLLDLIAEPER